MRRYLATARREQALDEEMASPDAAALAEATEPDFPPMRVLYPPPVANDAGMPALYEAIEEALRTAGHLR